MPEIDFENILLQQYVSSQPIAMCVDAMRNAENASRQDALAGR